MLPFRWKEIFKEFFPHTIYAGIMFFSLAGIILAQGFIYAANGNDLPVISNVSVTVDPNGAVFYLAVEGSNFTPSSVVRFDGIDKPTNFVDVNDLTVSIPAGVYDPDASVDITVFNYAPYSKLVIKGSNFLADSVARVDGKDLPTTYINGNQLEVDLGGATVGKRSLTVFSGSTKTESDSIPLEIPENSAPMLGEEINTILALARAEGVEIPSDLPAADDFAAKKTYAGILAKVEEKQEIKSVAQDVKNIASELGVVAPQLPAGSSLVDLKKQQADLQAKAKFFADKQEAIGLAQTAGLSDIIFPKDDDSAAPAFYVALKKKAQDRLKAFELVNSGVLEKADKYNISRSAPPALGTSNELDYYLNLDALVKAYEKAHPEVFAAHITSLSSYSAVRGAQITLTGSNFAAQGNSVYFYYYGATTRQAVIPNLASPNGVALTFAVPQTFVDGSLLNPGAGYKVSVIGASGTSFSNAVDFTVAPTPAPAITALSSYSAARGAQITLTGSNFAAQGNSVYFYFYGATIQSVAIPNLASPNGTTLNFTVPQTFSNGGLLQPGAGYKVSVSGGGAAGFSNQVDFTVAPQ